MAEDTVAAQMAADLIDHVKRTQATRVVVLEYRAAVVLAYLEKVARPNVHTLSHVRKFLDGTRDSILHQYEGGPDAPLPKEN